MKQVLKIEITIFNDEAPCVDVDLYVNETHEYDSCREFELGDDNVNLYDALVDAKNYAHELISNWYPNLESA